MIKAFSHILVSSIVLASCSTTSTKKPVEASIASRLFPKSVHGDADIKNQVCVSGKAKLRPTVSIILDVPPGPRGMAVDLVAEHQKDYVDTVEMNLKRNFWFRFASSDTNNDEAESEAIERATASFWQIFQDLKAPMAEGNGFSAWFKANVILPTKARGFGQHKEARPYYVQLGKSPVFRVIFPFTQTWFEDSRYYGVFDKNSGGFSCVGPCNAADVHRTTFHFSSEGAGLQNSIELGVLLRDFTLMVPPEVQEKWMMHEGMEAWNPSKPRSWAFGLRGDPDSWELSISNAVYARSAIWMAYAQTFSTLKKAPKNDGTIQYELSLDLDPFCKYGRAIKDLVAQ